MSNNWQFYNAVRDAMRRMAEPDTHRCPGCGVPITRDEQHACARRGPPKR